MMIGGVGATPAGFRMAGVGADVFEDFPATAAFPTRRHLWNDGDPRNVVEAESVRRSPALGEDDARCYEQVGAFLVA